VLCVVCVYMRTVRIFIPSKILPFILPSTDKLILYYPRWWSIVVLFCLVSLLHSPTPTHTHSHPLLLEKTNALVPFTIVLSQLSKARIFLLFSPSLVPKNQVKKKKLPHFLCVFPFPFTFLVHLFFLSFSPSLLAFPSLLPSTLTCFAFSVSITLLLLLLP